jgi:hypothetical protein
MSANIKTNIFFVLIFVLLQINAFSQQPKIVARINSHKLNIHYSYTDRAQLYSVIDSNEIILSVDSSLLFIRNNELINKARSPVHIFAFDVSKSGNGVILGGDRCLYRIKKFQIQNEKIAQYLDKPKEGLLIWTVDMLNDSIARFIIPESHSVYYTNINYLEDNKYLIDNDEVSNFISDACPTYVGEYKGRYYTLEYDLKEKSECLVIRSDLKTRISDKIFKFGYLGQTANETVPIRYDEETNFFYKMLFKDNEIVLYKFDIRDYK